VYDPASRSETQFTAGPADHEDPSWAPDGRHIVYAMTERYHSDIYLLDTGGDPQIRLTSVQGEWYSPEFSH
jgi:Tol biopolymer transport system component